jgi:electron transfer flavoprotein alpha subunit
VKIACILISSQHKEPEVIAGLTVAAKAIAADASIAVWWLNDDKADEFAILNTGNQKMQAEKVLICNVSNSEFYCAEAMLPILSRLFSEESPDILLFSSDTAGHELAVRLSYRLKLFCATDACAFDEEDNELIVCRMVYNAALMAKFRYDIPAVITVQTTSFQQDAGIAPERQNSKETDVLYQTAEAEDLSMPYKDISLQVSEAIAGLENAKRIVAIGRGIGSRENAAAATVFAEKINGMIGGSRPVTIDGWVPYTRQIGMSGHIVHPELCIILGASGAQAFAIGVRNSKLIIGVNTEKRAALFKICDVGAVCDAAEFLTALDSFVQGGD